MTNHFNCHEKERIKGEFCGGELEIMIERSQWGWALVCRIFLTADGVRVVVQIRVARRSDDCCVYLLKCLVKHKPRAGANLAFAAGSQPALLREILWQRSNGHVVTH